MPTGWRRSAHGDDARMIANVSFPMYRGVSQLTDG
jgi:hypothetical protein